MNTLQALNQPKSRPLSDAEAKQAGESGTVLKHLLETENAANQEDALRVSVEQPGGGKAELVLPGATLALLSAILREQGSGKSVVVLATDTEVTTQQAADYLQVSRPYLVKLLEEGDIPFRRVGPRRRMRLEDLLRYREQEEARRNQGLDELVAEAQAMKMY